MAKSLVSGKIVTPKGIAKFPRFVTPGEKYSDLGTCLLLETNSLECMAFTNYIEEVNEECYQAEVNLLQAARNPVAKAITRRPLIFKEEMDKEGNLTGYTQFQFSMPGFSREGTVNTVPKVDAKRNAMPSNTERTGGSIIKLSLYYQSKYVETKKTAGVKFYINAVQVISLAEYTRDFAFSDEDGYVYKAIQKDEDDTEEATINNDVIPF